LLKIKNRKKKEGKSKENRKPEKKLAKNGKYPRPTGPLMGRGRKISVS
jgi:hypothetical protein